MSRQRVVLSNITMTLRGWRHLRKIRRRPFLVDCFSFCGSKRDADNCDMVWLWYLQLSLCGGLNAWLVCDGDRSNGKMASRSVFIRVPLNQFLLIFFLSLILPANTYVWCGLGIAFPYLHHAGALC